MRNLCVMFTIYVPSRTIGGTCACVLRGGPEKTKKTLRALLCVEKCHRIHTRYHTAIAQQSLIGIREIAIIAWGSRAMSCFVTPSKNHNYNTRQIEPLTYNLLTKTRT